MQDIDIVLQMTIACIESMTITFLLTPLGLRPHLTGSQVHTASGRLAQTAQPTTKQIDTCHWTRRGGTNGVRAKSREKAAA